MSTEPEQNIPLKLVDEYKTVHDEIAMCQKEMHQTWLWATIAAGAIYTWLASHGSEINNLGSLHWFIWFVPPVLLFFCALRYWIFNKRITWLARYLCRIEKAAFGQDDNVPLPGVARYHQKCLEEPLKWPRWLGGAAQLARDAGRPSEAPTAPSNGTTSLPREASTPAKQADGGRAWKRILAWKTILYRGQIGFWGALIFVSIVVSIWLASTKSEDTFSGHVTDSSGHPMSALTVSLDSNHAVTTDTNGYFHNLGR
jgi:hypothetical protein